MNLTVDDVLGHNEFKGASTSCPCISMDVLRKRLKALQVPKKEEENKVSEQQLTPEQEKVRQEAIDLGITDGKNPFREVNQYYVWNALLPLARELAELKKKA